MGAPIVLTDVYKKENHTPWAVLLIHKYEFKDSSFQTRFKGAEKLMRKTIHCPFCVGCYTLVLVILSCMLCQVLQDRTLYPAIISHALV